MTVPPSAPPLPAQGNSSVVHPVPPTATTVRRNLLRRSAARHRGTYPTHEATAIPDYRRIVPDRVNTNHGFALTSALYRSSILCVVLPAQAMLLRFLPNSSQQTLLAKVQYPLTSSAAPAMAAASVVAGGRIWIGDCSAEEGDRGRLETIEWCAGDGAWHVVG